VSPSLPLGLYHDSLLWYINGASSSVNALSAIDAFYTSRRSRSRVTATPAMPATPAAPAGNKLIVITKVKIITLYKACKCDSSIAIGLCGIAILQEVVHTRSRLIWDMERELEGDILKWCQEPHFNYRI
jgi:hypothetical protein